MTRNLILMTLVVAGFATQAVFAQQQTAPGWTAALSSIEDETAFVVAFRDAERAQLARLAEEQAVMDGLRRAGKQAEAEAKLEEIKAVLGEVRAAFDYALGRYPENARLLTYKGEFLYDYTGEQNEALRLWMRSLTLDDKLALTHNNLSLNYAHVGQYRLSLDHLDKALALDKKNADFHYNLAQFYLVYGPQTEELRKWKKKKVYKEAMTASKRAHELAPDDFELAKDHAVNYFAGENFQVEVNWKEGAKAWQTARSLAKSNTDVFYAWLNEARCWIRSERDKEAMACLEEALKIFPDSDVAQRLLGELELKQEKGGKG